MDNNEFSSHNMEPLISVIIPIFQVESFLEKCISSIITQTYDNLEIILVDDGSTDNSSAICDRFQAQDKRIKVIHQENSGLSHARNIGLKNATGDFIGFVDSDDWIEPNMYDVLLSAVQETGADIAVCNYCREIETSKAIQNKIVFPKIQLYSNETALKMLISGKKNINICVWNKLYRSSIISTIRFPEGKICEDIQWTPQVIGNAKTVAFIDYPFYHYLYRNRSLVHDCRIITKRLQDRIDLYQQLIEYIRINFPKLEKLTNAQFANFYCWEYINIFLADNQFDVDYEIRNNLHCKFRQLGFINILDVSNIKMTLARVLFWYYPNLFFKLYIKYKRMIP